MMTMNYNKTHYRELKRLSSYLGKSCNRYEQIFDDDEFSGYRVLTVSGGGYAVDSPESEEIIEAFVESGLLSAIDSPDNPNGDEAAIRYYLIDDYDYLIERVSVLIDELRLDGVSA
jgi:hypothetical protein